ncbi:MAG: hypothetical protein WBV39_16585 [Rudaea sp.]
MQPLPSERAKHCDAVVSTRPAVVQTDGPDQRVGVDEAARVARQRVCESAALRKAATELDDLREQNARLRAAAAQMRQQVVNLHRALDVATVAAHAAETAMSLAHCRNIHDGDPDTFADQAMPGDVVLLRVHCQNIVEQLKAMRGSLSWRITKPLRVMAEVRNR